MERFNTRTIDKTNKVIVPRELIAKMALDERPKLYLYPAGNILILQKYSKPNIPEYAVTVNFDELKRITVPEEIMGKMNWEAGDAVSFYRVDSEMVVIKLGVD